MKISKDDIVRSLSSTPKYYMRDCDTKFYAEGVILFSVIPHVFNNSGNFYTLLKIKSCNQDCEIVDVSDISEEENFDTPPPFFDLYDTFLDIISNKNSGFKEISEEQFQSTRIDLLNDYKRF